jgi:hypothetical protein
LKNGMGLIAGWNGVGIVSLDLRVKRFVSALLVVALARVQNDVVTGISTLEGLC